MAKATVTSNGITVKETIGSYTIERSNITKIDYTKGIFIGILRVLTIFFALVNPIGTTRLFLGHVKVTVSIYGKEDAHVFWLTREDYKNFITEL